MKTIDEINEEIKSLEEQKQELEDQTLNQTIYGLFSQMTKEEVLAKIGGMMEESPMLKMEVKRLLIDNPQDQDK
jgi:hypothetical protein